MPKDSTITSAPVGESILITILAWLIPGAGHLALGLWRKALILGGSVYALFIAGLFLRGHFYDLSATGEGFVHYLYGLFNLGIGLLYMICYGTGSAMIEYPEAATFEYGNVCLLFAGLLNFMVMFNAYDLKVERSGA